MAGSSRVAWRDLPASTALEDGGQPLYRWRQQGIFDRLLAEVHRRADACGELDWLVHYVNGSVVRAPSMPPVLVMSLPMRMGKRDCHPPDEALGRSRAG